MATDVGELLVPYMPTIRVPRSGERVYKSECAFSYDTPESEGGLYVCMNTFLGFGREHVERHYRKTGQGVFLHLKRTVKEKPSGAAGGALPRRKNGTVFLDIELNRNYNGDDYDYEDEAKLVIFPQHFEIPLPNIEELPALVTIACDAVLNASSPYRKPDPLPWEEEELQVSKHARTLRQEDNHVQIPPSGWKCSCCEMRENLWLNLTDGAVHCGKWFCDGTGGNGHAVEHYRHTGFPLAVRLDTISPDGADVYSFDEEEAVLDPRLGDHLGHFGIDVLQKKKPEVTRPGGELPPHSSEFQMMQESGHKLKAVYGCGYTGIRNTGNSSYVGTTMQILFSIPEFQRAYVGNLQRLFDYSPLDPTQDFPTQMAKLGHALLSGQYSKPPVKSELIEQVVKGDQKLLERPQGVSIKMFKALVSRGHEEFSSSRQQDMLQFFRHIIRIVERGGGSVDNPSEVFRFLLEERTQCCQSRRVRYSQRTEFVMQLPVPLEAASNREELLAYEAQRNRSGEDILPPLAPVRPRVPFSACLQAFTEPHNVPDFWSSALQAKSAGVKTLRFATFPDYMVLQVQKFTFGLDWIPKKIDVSVEMPDFLDLSRLRATGLQPGEEELPDLAPPIVVPEDPRGSTSSTLDSTDMDETAVMQLADMGFPIEACRKAVYYTGNMGAEMAFSWILAHMEEPDFAEPLGGPTLAEAGLSGHALPSQADRQPPEESVSILTSMGFTRPLSIQALKATNNNLERALDWIFSHPDGEEEEVEEEEESHHNGLGGDTNGVSDSPTSAQQEAPGSRVKDGPGRYELFGFVSHMGASTMSGHYVCHIKKEGRWVIYNDHKVCLSEKPPKDLGYVYFYRRLSHN